VAACFAKGVAGHVFRLQISCAVALLKMWIMKIISPLAELYLSSAFGMASCICRSTNKKSGPMS
jgi:hypothetical protein